MTETKPRLGIIIGSTRSTRMSKPIADWVFKAAKADGKFEVELVDLAEVNLPLYDEPGHPLERNYTQEHTKRWSKIVENLDAFIFISPEYNHSFPAALKNALDYLAYEWQNKPASIVTYGGVSAGTRAAEHLQQVMHGLGLKVVRSAVMIPFHFSRDFSDGFPATEAEAQSLQAVLDELSTWEKVLRPLREV